MPIILFKKISISSLALILLLSSVSIVGALTWVNPTEKPPDNGDIQILDTTGRDGLGNHIATQDINFTGHRIYDIGATGADRAMVATTTGNTITALIKAEDQHGSSIRSSSSAGDPAVYVRNLSTGYALVASSTRGWGAQFGQALQIATTTGIAAQVMWKSNNASIANVLSTSSVLPSATKNFYWSTSKLCDFTKANCGRVLAGAGDNLGNHIAQFDLDMKKFALINLENKIGTTLATSSLQLSNIGTGSDAATGLYSLSDETHGIVAENTIQTSAIAVWGHNQGSGYGLAGSSLNGPGMSLYGRLNLLTEADGTEPQLTFGDAIQHNNLALAAGADPANQDLYWGNSLLCDADQPDCGRISVASGVLEHWSSGGGNLFTNNLVSIGGIGQQAKLEVLVPSDISFTPQNISLGYPGAQSLGTFSVGSDMTDIEGNKLYVLTRDRISIYSLINPQTPSFLGSIAVSGGPFNSNGASMDVLGKYAYIVKNTDLILVDISNPTPTGTPVPIVHYLGGNFGGIRIVVSSHYAYVLGSKLATVDISDPMNLNQVDTMDLGTLRNDIAISGDYLYVADHTGGIIRVDIADPRNPRFAGENNPAGFARNALAITTRGGIAYVLYDNNLLYALDISSDGAVSALGYVDMVNTSGSNQATSLALAGRYVYVTHSNSNGSDYDLSIIDALDPTNMSIVMEEDYGDWGLYSISMYGDYGYAYNDDAADIFPITTGIDHLVALGRLPITSFSSLKLGYGQADSAMISGNITNNSSMYVRGGVSIRSNLTLSAGRLNSGIGTITIGNVKLTRDLLNKLIIWSNS